MKIVSWNINSINARYFNIMQFIKNINPDIILLQELKIINEKFPYKIFKDIGYNIAINGQKSYNGVAILSKYTINKIIVDLPFVIKNDEDTQSRYIEIIIKVHNKNIRIVSIYIPNGNPINTEKYLYKLKWFDRLIEHTKTLISYDERLLIGGDYNVIPTNNDVWNADKLHENALISSEVRKKFRNLKNLGLIDCFDITIAEKYKYTFWDYQNNSRIKDNGMRIDHLLISPKLADNLIEYQIEEYTRDWEKPSDHVPIMATFNI